MNTNILDGHFAPVPDFADTAILRTQRVILTADNSTLTIYSAATPHTILLSATLPSPPLCALDCCDTVIVMTERAIRYITCSAGQWTLLPEETVAPAVSFSAEPLGIVQATTASITSSRATSLAEGVPPSSTLQRKITSALATAYSSLTASAREGGLYIQPVVARCLFLDSSGCVIALSSPQLVALPRLWQAVEPVSASVTKRSDTDFSISPFTLSVTPWKLHLDLSALASHPLYPAMASVKVLVSPPVDILDKKALAPVRFSHTHGNSPICAATLPGATEAFSPLTSRFMEAAAQMARSPSSLLHVATIPPHTSHAVIAPPVAPMRYPFPPLCRFTASSVTRTGNTVAWADVRPLPPLPLHPAAILLPGTESFPVTVDMLAGDTVLSSVTLEAGSLSHTPRPVICSDSPQVTHIRLTFLDTGTTLTLPVINTAPSLTDGHIVSASFSAPLAPLASVQVSASPVTAVTPAARSQSTWDFSRTHLYAFSPEGTYAVSFSARGAFLSSALIDNRPALGSAVFTPHGVFAAVQGGLALFTGSAAKAFVPLPENASALYYRSADDLVLVLTHTGNRYWVTPQGQFTLIAPMPSFVYEEILSVRKATAPRIAVIPLLAEDIEAQMTIYADSGRLHEASFTCAAAEISGRADKPVALRIVDTPNRRRVWLRISGTASPDLAISTPAIIPL